MEAAKAAVSKFTSNRGHHTSVEESVQPGITQETVKPHRHEEATQAVDREVHQHHYHTTVQPLSHQERLPEKHTHNILPTEHREFRHDNEHETKQRLATELGQFKDHSRTEQTRHTQSAAPAVTGEHVHHHVHETVVPVVHKETIQPEVVHTTVPIHETHHAAAQHHGLSALPMKTLDEFSRAGGKLTGGSHGSHEEYEGQPRHYNDKLSTTFEKLGLAGAGAGAGAATAATAGTKSQHRPTDSGISGVGGPTNTGVGQGSGIGGGTHGTGMGGTHGTGIGSGTQNTQGYGTGLGSGTHGTGIGSGTQNTQGYSSGHRGVGAGAAGAGVAAAGVGAAAHHHRRRGSNSSSSSSDESVGGTRRKKDKLSRRAVGTGGATGAGAGLGSTNTTSSTSTGTKPSLMDRLNPRKDADRDGKAGIGN